MKASRKMMPSRMTMAWPAWIFTMWLRVTPPAPHVAPTMAPPQKRLFVLSVKSSIMADGATSRETERMLPTAWSEATSMRISRVKMRYCMALTGTPWADATFGSNMVSRRGRMYRLLSARLMVLMMKMKFRSRMDMRLRSPKSQLSRLAMMGKWGSNAMPPEKAAVYRTASAVLSGMREFLLTNTEPRPTRMQANSAPMKAFAWVSCWVMSTARAIPGSMVCERAETERALRLRFTKPLKKPLANPITVAPMKGAIMRSMFARWFIFLGWWLWLGCYGWVLGGV